MSVATIYDVARKARVSATTVSRVISGGLHVDETSSDWVNAAIASLKHQVSLAARSVRKGTSRIGLLLSSPGAAFMSDFLLGAMDQCGQQGTQLIVELPKGCLRIVRGWRPHRYCGTSKTGRPQFSLAMMTWLRPRFRWRTGCACVCRKTWQCVVWMTRQSQPRSGQG